MRPWITSREGERGEREARGNRLRALVAREREVDLRGAVGVEVGCHGYGPRCLLEATLLDADALQCAPRPERPAQMYGIVN